MAGATATSVELAVSGTVPLGTVLPAMLGVHALIGVGEAVVTVAAVSAVLATRPDLIPGVEHASRPRPSSPEAADDAPLFVILALAVAVGLGTAISPFASSSPGRAREGRRPTRPSSTTAGRHSLQDDSPIPDYAFPGVDERAPRDRPGRLHRHAARVRRSATASPRVAPARRPDDGMSGCAHALHAAGVAGDPASPIHRLDPRAKLIGFAGVTLVAVSTPLHGVARLRRRARSRWP